MPGIQIAQKKNLTYNSNMSECFSTGERAGSKEKTPNRRLIILLLTLAIALASCSDNPPENLPPQRPAPTTADYPDKKIDEEIFPTTPTQPPTIEPVQLIPITATPDNIYSNNTPTATSTPEPTLTPESERLTLEQLEGTPSAPGGEPLTITADETHYSSEYIGSTMFWIGGQSSLYQNFPPESGFKPIDPTPFNTEIPELPPSQGTLTLVEGESTMSAVIYFNPEENILTIQEHPTTYDPGIQIQYDALAVIITPNGTINYGFRVEGINVPAAIYNDPRGAAYVIIPASQVNKGGVSARDN
jgi:hypothetical protein